MAGRSGTSIHFEPTTRSHGPQGSAPRLRYLVVHKVNRCFPAVVNFQKHERVTVQQRALRASTYAARNVLLALDATHEVGSGTSAVAVPVAEHCAHPKRDIAHMTGMR